MKNAKRYFTGISRGEVCTGTIQFYGLQAARLVESGLVSLENPDNENGLRHPDYVFRGFDGEKDPDPA
jgi:hypothetical protein